MAGDRNKIAADIDLGMLAYVALARSRGEDVKTAERAFKAGAMWAMRCFGVILEEELQSELQSVKQAGPSRRDE